MILARQRVLVRLTQGAGGRIGRLDLVKHAFLLAQEAGVDSRAVYEFLPYQYGPFSFTLYHELDALIQAKILQAPDDRSIVLAGNGAQAAFIPDAALRAGVDLVVERYGGLTTTLLLDYVYLHYPWFAVKSIREKKSLVAEPVAPCAIYTAGYAGMQVDGFIDLLLRRGIKRLIDVRANPVSRKYGFHKKTLASICAKIGLDYHHCPEVGVPSALRVDLHSTEDYRRLLNAYQSDILPQQDRALRQISQMMTEVPSVLMCQEEDPGCCHRSPLARDVSRRTSRPVQDLRVQHATA